MPVDNNTTSANTVPLEATIEDPLHSSISIYDLDLDLDELDCSLEFKLLTQHLQTSLLVRHTRFKPKSIFYPTKSKGPYLGAFYRVFFQIFKNCVYILKPHINISITT